MLPCWPRACAASAIASAITCLVLAGSITWSTTPDLLRPDQAARLAFVLGGELGLEFMSLVGRRRCDRWAAIGHNRRF
jgi:hypothetical protein